LCCDDSAASRFAALAEIRVVSLLLSKRFAGGNNSRAERDSAVKSICVFSCCFPYSYALCAILCICGDAILCSNVDFCLGLINTYIITIIDTIKQIHGRNGFPCNKMQIEYTQSIVNFKSFSILLLVL